MEAAHFFEGTEKLLEVWFSRQQSDASQGSGDLRTIPRWVQGTWGVRRGSRLGLRWGQVGGRELASPAAAVAGPPGGGEEAGAAACSGNEAGAGGARSPGRCGSARRAGAGEGRAEHELGGPGPRGCEQASRRGLGGRAWRSGGGIGRERPCRSAGPAAAPTCPAAKRPGTVRGLPPRLLTLGCVTCYWGEVRASAAMEGFVRYRGVEAGQPRDLFNAFSGSKRTWGPARTRAVTRDHRLSRAERLVVSLWRMESRVEVRLMVTMYGPGGGGSSCRLWGPRRGLRRVPRGAAATGVAVEPAWSGSLRGGPMSSWALREPGSRVWTNGRFRNVGCALQPSSDKKREENPGGHVLPRL